MPSFLRATMCVAVPLAIATGCAAANPRPSSPASGTVTAEDLQKNPDEPIERVLQRKVPGLTVTRTADGGIALNIRGTTTYDGSTAPLYVIDGLATAPGSGGALTGIDPYTIESIKVLKGAEAGMYGIQGLNGVIVVTTKQPGTKKPDAPTVELHSFHFSPTISVFGWTNDETSYGLTARMRRDGSVVRDHRLYVSTYYAADVRAFPRAAVPSQNRPLKVTGVSRDIYHCKFGPTCTPYETFGARIPDALLRANRDSLAVRFYDRVGRELFVTVHRDLIDAYLMAVDSLSASLNAPRRKRGD